MTTLAPNPSFPATSCLEVNLNALVHFNPAAAAAVRAVEPRPDVTFLDTEEGARSAEVRSAPGAQALASRRRPLAEAKAFAEAIDISRAGVYLVAGFALGHHVRAVLDRLNRQGLVIVFEPDAALLRAVFDRIDCSAFLAQPNLRILTDPDDRGAMIAATARAEGYVGLGVRLIEHAPSKPRLAGSTAAFYRNFLDVIESVKMAVLTTLMQARVTFGNLLANLPAYCAAGGIADLAGACTQGGGRPAIVVAAGPSLARNIDLLAEPAIRDRFVIIAVQTVLKPLLTRGIRPHFVTALDYSDVSKRFYEGLTRADVDGLTLVVEPKVHPTVLEAWPGELRCVGDALCDRLLGNDLSAHKGPLTAGATVAHLAYYLARHLGCDPVALVGQDLGFTDGQYYAANAAIHQTWACELNEFNTLEMLEWQRIVRMGPHLRRATDTLGRPVYTDEQMVTYLTQFERDFKADADRGLTTIDATEGGVRKRHTAVSTLREFLDTHANAGGGAPPVSVPAVRSADAPGRDRVFKRLRDVRAQVRRVAQLSRTAAAILTEMREHQRDQARVNRLIGRLEPITAQVVAIDPAYTLVHTLGQTVAFNRMRADRSIEIDAALTPLERQALQVERDLGNVESLATAADELGALLDHALTPPGGAPLRKPASASAPPARESVVAAIIPVDLTQTHLAGPMADAAGVLALTIERLGRSVGLSAVVLATEDKPALERLLMDAGVRRGIRIVSVAPGRIAGARARALRARAWSGACWRGGIGNATCFDEAYLSRETPAILEEAGADAALVLGPDWCFIDPTLCQAVIARHQENPGENRFVFTQAPPGLGPCLIARDLAAQLATAPERGPWSLPLGAILAYIPRAPGNDLIASRACVAVPPAVRDAARRFIPDSPVRLRSFALACAGARAPEITSESLVAAPELLPGPEHLHLEIAPTEARRMFRAPDGVIPEHVARETIRQWFSLRPDGALTLALGGDDPAAHTLLASLVSYAKSTGVEHVHARTSLRCDAAAARALAESGVDVVSVDLMADTGETYASIVGAGSDEFARARANVDSLLAANTGPLIVPRLTRCDGAYSDVELFFARWMERAGWCVIDPLPGARSGERIGPLPAPASAARAQARARLSVLADGAVPAAPAWTPAGETVARIPEQSLGEAWERARAARGVGGEP